MSLYDAAEAGDLARVQVLVEQGAEKDETFGEMQKTALTAAAENGHLPVVRYLVEQGADMERAGRYGWTPLMIASWLGRLGVVRYLLEQGANRDKADVDGWTPLHRAACYDHLKTVKMLMSYGADLNARDKDGRSPIDVTTSETIRQAIRDEPRRRLDHGHKRATEQDRHPNAATSASGQQDGDEVGGKEEVEGNVADEDQDSEPSDDEDDN